MNCVFRLDANRTIGYGHLSRCLVLAKILSDKGYNCSFFLVNAHSDVLERINSAGHSIKNVAVQASLDNEIRMLIDYASAVESEWIILDSYKYNYHHESCILLSQLNLCSAIRFTSKLPVM